MESDDHLEDAASDPSFSLKNRKYIINHLKSMH